METLNTLLHKLTQDERVGAVHLSLYVALLQCREEQGGADPVYLIREEVMRKARIRGVTTYYKTLKELDKYGLVGYRPSKRGESVVILNTK